MLVEFRVKNFRSIMEEQVLSLVASKDKELTNNVTHIKKFDLLKSAVIYGANSSGKSNIIKALDFMRFMLVSPLLGNQDDDFIPVDVFALSTTTEKEPAMFELTFFVNEIRYRYGFEVNTDEIVSEWLFYVPNKQEIQLFLRDKETFIIHNVLKKEGKGLTDKTRDNVLFLSILHQFNSKLTEEVYNYFKKLKIVQGDIKHYLGNLSRQMNHGKNNEIINNLLKKIDLQIECLRCEEEKLDIDNVPPELRTFIEKHETDFTGWSYNTTHNKYNEQGDVIGTVDFDLDLNESDGTKQFICLIGPFMDTISNEGVLIVDELENSLHPLLVEFIIKLFSLDKKIQLIFTTHNTKLLSSKLFRRDQIWFTEKNQQGATSLQSLYDFSVRKDASYEKDYLAGKYGAIPYLEDISESFNG
ncbi:MAG: abortive infection protein [Denitrovibrio sp.]|nr:MAG: abortive infection protein [Denitrovibrio sp.]